MLLLLLMLLNALPIKTDPLANNAHSIPLANTKKQGVRQSNLMQFPSDNPPTKHLSISFNDALEIAKQRGLSAMKAVLWAYRFHDPSKDKYSLLNEWLKMNDSPDKKEFKNKMLLNPTLGKILDWEGGFDLTHYNMKNAITERDLDMAKLLIAMGYEPILYDLIRTIILGEPDIFKILIEDGKLIPDTNHLTSAAHYNQLEILKYLVNTQKLKPHQIDLNYAVLNENSHMVEFLIIEGGINPSLTDMKYAIQIGSLKILKLLFSKGVNPAQEEVFSAIYWGRLDIYEYLVEELKIYPTQQDLQYTLLREDPDTVKYWTIAREVRPTIDDLDFAINGKGRLDILKYLIEEYARDIISKETLTNKQSAQKMELYLKLLNHYLLDNISDSLILKIKSGLSQDQLKYLESKEAELEKLKCQICMNDQIQCYFSCHQARKFTHGACRDCFTQVKKKDNRCPWCRKKGGLFAMFGF